MFRFLAQLFLIVMAITLIRSVLAIVTRAVSGAMRKPQPGPEAGAQTRRAPQAPSATALEQDPVCGTYVSVDSSFKKIVRGTVYHFCSDKCRDEYAG